MNNVMPTVHRPNQMVDVVRDSVRRANESSGSGCTMRVVNDMLECQPK